MHFDDRLTEPITLPDETIHILDEVVDRCCCDRAVRAWTGKGERCRSDPQFACILAAAGAVCEVSELTYEVSGNLRVNLRGTPRV